MGDKTKGFLGFGFSPFGSQKESYQVERMWLAKGEKELEILPVCSEKKAECVP